MSALGQYVYTVIIGALLISILLSFISDKGAISSSIKIVAGVFIAFIVISPVAKIRLNNMDIDLSFLENDASLIIAAARNETKENISKVISERIDAYILDRASSMGAKVTTEITFQHDDEYHPESITISGAVSPYVKNRLSTIIADDLGIPEERQIWKLA